jgi:hypothetical protein
MTVSKPAVTNFVHALIAVIIGNLVYFLAVPYLPSAAHHVARRMDLGMVVDFWFCLLVLGIVKTVARRRQVSNLHNVNGPR